MKSFVAILSAAAGAAYAMDAQQMFTLLRGHAPADVQVKRDVSMSCCAGFEDGTYFANMTIATDFGRGLCIKNGYFAVDAEGERAVWVSGGDLPKNSEVGWFARRCTDTGKLFATAWHGKDCLTYEIEDEYLPRMCVGEDSYLSEHECTVNLDDEVCLDIFSDKCGMGHWAVNLETCNPYGAFIDLSKPTKSNPFMPPGSDWHHRGFIGMLFHDMTSDCAADELFAAPAICARDSYAHHCTDKEVVVPDE